MSSLLLPSVLPQALANREVPIPEHIDMYLLDKEMPASDKIALHVSHRCSSQFQAAPHTNSWHSST
jgi:ATP-binding cassette subfamily F protein 2